MVLIVDRGSTENGIYSFSFGADFDVLINTWKFPIHGIDKEELSDVDKIITNSISLTFCVLYLKHPLLLKDYNSSNESFHNRFFNNLDDRIYKRKLREYFALRLIHRRFPILLTEFGNRLF
jgi:hypothetical protein